MLTTQKQERSNEVKESYKFKATPSEVDLERIIRENEEDNKEAFIVVGPVNCIVGVKRNVIERADVWSRIASWYNVGSFDRSNSTFSAVVPAGADVGVKRTWILRAIERSDISEYVEFMEYLTKKAKNKKRNRLEVRVLTW